MGSTTSERSQSSGNGTETRRHLRLSKGLEESTTGPWHRGHARLSHPGFSPTGHLTEPKDPIQGHVLSYVKQGRHGQLLGQTQSGSKIEAVTWGTDGHLVSGTHLGGPGKRATQEKVHSRGCHLATRKAVAGGLGTVPQPGSQRWGGGVSPT